VLQRLIVRVERERRGGGLRVCRPATDDQLQQDSERLLVSRRRKRQDDGVPNVGPVLAGQMVAEPGDGLGSAGLAERHGGGPRDVAVARGQPLGYVDERPSSGA
jgi:hypothetical protein